MSRKGIYRSPATACSHSDRMAVSHGKCDQCYHADYYAANKSRWPKYDPNNYIAKVERRCRRKGITTALYLTLLWNQEGKCPCGRELESSQIDHDHKCCPGKKACGGCVRGLLCSRCNLLLGMVENEHHLIPAYLIEYLNNTEKRRSNLWVNPRVLEN